MKLRLMLLVSVFLSAACQRTQHIPEKSFWSGTLELAPGVDLPFQMNLDFSGPKASGYFLNGEEKTAIPEIERNGTDVSLKFSEYSAEMRATWDGNELRGNYLRIRSAGTKSLKFTASPETEPAPAARVDSTVATGNYQVSETTVAKLWSKDGASYGTFIATDGDLGLLVGRTAAGKGIQLNRFTGWQAISIVLVPAEDGTLQAKYYAASNDKPQDLVLRPRSDLNIQVPERQQTAMKDAGKGYAFSGVSLDGQTVRSTDERFKGKALIVDIMGTWCHNCLDEAPLLQQLQREHGKDGLEIVGLAFEISDDPALAKKNIQLFKDRFGISYTLLFCGSLDDENIKKQIRSQVDHFFAYPTTFFLDKDHKVQFIHSGFNGPGTGEGFQAQIKEFQEAVGRLGL